MLGIDDYNGVAPTGSTYMGSYRMEADRSFTQVGSKSEDEINLENFVTDLLKNPNKAIGFGPKI